MRITVSDAALSLGEEVVTVSNGRGALLLHRRCDSAGHFAHALDDIEEHAARIAAMVKPDVPKGLWAKVKLLPKFAELLVLDVQLPEGSEVGQLLTVVCDVGDRGSTISAVIDAVAKLAGGAAMLGAPVIGTLAAAGLRLGAQSLKAALAPEDAQSVQGTVYLEATRVGDVVRLQACAGHEDYPLLQLDERGDPRVGGDINAVELEMVSGEEVRLMTACHECGDCRVNVYLRVRVA